MIVKFSVVVLLLLTTNTVLCRRKLPFQINGPRSLNDRIAIVGAGPAGIHMALALKQRGFTNVAILEKEDYLGGKSWTVQRRGAAQEMGTVYLAPDYNDTIIPLVNKYAPGDLVVLPEATIWLDGLAKPVRFKEYVLKYVMEHFKTNDSRKAVQGLIAAIQKYIKIHVRVFGRYEGELMPEPTKKVQWELRGTYMQFLERNGIDVIAPVLYASNSVQGYGRIDEIPTLYGMMWNTPKMMYALLKRFGGKDKETGFFMLKSGFQNLWKNIVKRESLKIEFNVNIRKLYRPKSSHKNSVWIQRYVRKSHSQKHHSHNHHRKHHRHTKWDKFDFVIWSPEMKTSLRTWDTYPDELYYFSRTQPQWYTTTLLDTVGVQRGPTPIDYMFDNINKRREGSVWAQRDSYAALRNYSGAAYQAGRLETGDDRQSIRTTVAYQMSDRRPSRIELEYILTKTLQQTFGATYTRIVYAKTWRYFPKYSCRDISKGYLWRILEMQGKHGMWYIGSSVIFESVKSVVEYNELILKNFIVPTN